MDPFSFTQGLKVISGLVLGYFCYRRFKKAYDSKD
jgi:hypothetical protein